MKNAETLNIQATLEHMISPSATQTEVDEHFAEIISASGHIDLQQTRLAVVEHDRNTLQESFLGNPLETITNEHTYLARLSSERTFRYHRAGQMLSAFVTRSTTGASMDALYVSTSDGPVTIRTTLQDQLAEPCIISTFGNKLSIESQVYRRGAMHAVQQSLEPGEYGYKLYRACVGSMVWASHLALTRSHDERSQADEAARSLVIADAKRA